MTSVLVLGSHGLLGQEFLRFFHEKGIEATGYNHSALDITNEADVRAVLDAVKPDCLVNTASMNAVDVIETDDAVFMNAQKVNGEAPGMLARLAKEQNIVFVHFSTDYVFDGEKRDGYREDYLSSPMSRYGKTKAAGEDEVKKQGEKYYIVRLSKLFGKPGTSANSKKSFVDTMIWLATEGNKEKLEVVDEEISCPTYAPDVVAFTVGLIEQTVPFGVYHGANSGPCSWYALAKKALECKGISVPVLPVSADKFPRPAPRPMFSELLNTKRPLQRSWEEALAEYLL